MSLDFVMLGAEEDWEAGRIGHRTLFLAHALSRHGSVEKVLLVNSPRSMAGRIKDRSLKQKNLKDLYPVIETRGRLFASRLGEKLFALNATSFFPENDGVFSRMDRTALAKKMGRFIQRLGFRSDVLWVADPRMADIAEKLRGSVKIFDAIDDMLAHPQLGRFRKKIQSAYRWAESSTDFICVASEKQRRMFSERARLFLLPNGVDDIFFENASSSAPADIERIARPRIVYAGTLQDRIDVRLIEETAGILPEHQFIFIGPETARGYFERLKQKKNVHFLGARSHADVAAYLRSADVCMVPHKINALTESMDPIKVYEYLACGKPVVATGVAGTKNFENYVTITEDARSLADAVLRVSAENSALLEAARREAMRRHAWSGRVDQLLSRIKNVESFDKK